LISVRKNRRKELRPLIPQMLEALAKLARDRSAKAFAVRSRSMLAPSL
jgi:hypothetical protein